MSFRLVQSGDSQSGSDDVFLPNSQSSQSSSDDDYINNYVPNCIAAPPTPDYINAADEEYDNIDMSAFGACIGAAPQRGGLSSNNYDAVPGNAGMLLESIHDYGYGAVGGASQIYTQRRCNRGPEDETPFDWRDLPAPMTRHHNRTEFVNRWKLKDHPHRRLFEDFYEERPEIYAEDTDVYDTIPPFTGHMRQGLRPGSDGSIQWEGDSEQLLQQVRQGMTDPPQCRSSSVDRHSMAGAGRSSGSGGFTSAADQGYQQPLRNCTTPLDGGANFFAGSTPSDTPCGGAGFYAGSTPSDTPIGGGVGFYAGSTPSDTPIGGGVGFYAGSTPSDTPIGGGVGFYAGSTPSDTPIGGGVGFYAGSTPSDTPIGGGVGFYAGSTPSDTPIGGRVGFYAGSTPSDNNYSPPEYQRPSPRQGIEIEDFPLIEGFESMEIIEDGQGGGGSWCPCNIF